MVVVSHRVPETGKLGRGQGRVSGQAEVAAAAGQISKVAVLCADQGAYATGQRAARRGRDGVLGQGWRRRQGIGVGGRVGVGRHVVIVLAAEFQVLLLLVVEVRVVRGRGKVLVAHQIHRAAGRGQEVVVVVVHETSSCWFYYYLLFPESPLVFFCFCTGHLDDILMVIASDRT